MLQFPEFKRKEGAPELNGAGTKLIYCLGGFAALANPASFHAPIIRKLRGACLGAAVRGAFRRALAEDTDIKLEVLFDRLMIRQPWQKPAAEAWHRDLTPEPIKKPGDRIYGGWLNLDTEPQYFSHVPGTHAVVAQVAGRTDDVVKPAGHHRCTAEESTEYATKKKRLVVPPGHLIIFSQDIIHEIVAEGRPAESIR